MLFELWALRAARHVRGVRWALDVPGAGGSAWLLLSSRLFRNRLLSHCGGRVMAALFSYFDLSSF